MFIKKQILLASMIGLVFGVSSCKRYLDVNKNPNVTPTATPATLLPTSQMYVASAMGVDLQVNGSIWAEYWTQDPSASQYRTLEQYQPTQSTYETPWLNLYTAAENFYQLDKLAASLKKKQYVAISFIMKAYTFQVLTDGWGDIPFKEALKGLPSDGGITSPHYDAQQVVYTGILAYLDSANALLDPSDVTKPGVDDLIYGGDMTKWQAFSNTLRLKILMRMSAVDPAGAQAGINALYATGPSFIDESNDAQINFSTTAGNKNPFYAEAIGVGGTQNVVGSSTIIDTMNADDDYRAFIDYEYVASAGVPVGIKQGAYDAVVAAGSYSLPTPYMAGDASAADASNAFGYSSASAPVKFLTSYESAFLQAEAVVRFGVAGDDAALFMQGVHASIYTYAYAYAAEDLELADYPQTSVNGDTITSPIFLTPDFAYYSYFNGDTIYGAPPAYWGQYPTSGSMTEKLRFIITQKWLSMCGSQGFEAWTEYRRTGYPDFLVISSNSLIGNEFPKRFLYPSSESTENSNYPGLKSITDKVWWDLL